MVADMLVRRTEQFFQSLGPFGLFLLAFIESSFFPIPPDILLIPMVLAAPSSWIYLAAITTIGSVLGAFVGYMIGLRGGRPALDYFISRKNVERAEEYYDRYGILAVGIAGFSPVPYKVFTITSGAFRMDMRGFLAVSILSRGLRFFTVALLVRVWGREVVRFLHSYFGPVSLFLGMAVAAVYIVWKRYY
ncbi:MAG: YqaA family protein [Candidatus Nanohaloarchaea archaeon]|nr:YqaA family protein [Candidatus Nanohaloarchaea archaeon]